MVIYREETWGTLAGIKNEYVELFPKECRKHLSFKKEKGIIIQKESCIWHGGR